jgi:NIPSNAP
MVSLTSMTRWRSIAIGIVTVWVGAGMAGLHSSSAGRSAAGAPAVEQAQTRVFELRTYTANPGKFEAMKNRFRDHILPLFKKHNLTVVGFWSPADAPASENTLIYILAHESREAAKKNWAAFSADPVRKQVWADTEKEGPINMKVESVFMNPTDFSPIK